ncbi:MAG: carboxypeptidase regulatory-like domain-containing protein, partial [Planctomycetales bacterium]
MKWLVKLARWSRTYCKSASDAHEESAPIPRVCRMEKMERREMLSADPLHFGAVYYEDAFTSGADLTEPGDLIEISFEGGAAATQLVEATLDLDPLGGDLEAGDRIFDTIAGGLGSSGAVPLTIVENDGVDHVAFSLDNNALDGATSLTIHFVGFDPGDRLVLGVDVDEVARGGLTPTVEGAEFEGATISGSFVAEAFYDAQADGVFLNNYDHLLNGTGLTLPPNDFVPPGTIPAPDFTAGAIASIQQQPLPASVSGTVYEDVNANSNRDLGDAGLEGVQLELFAFDGMDYVSTGREEITDAAGEYSFADLLPGEYRIVESQPDGLFSVSASAGDVDGDVRGTVLSPDVITDIDLVGGENSENNDFGESLPGTVSGFVYHDRDDDGARDAGEEGIADAVVRLLDDQGAIVASAATDVDGAYRFENLEHGTYSLLEEQPVALIDGLDSAGTAGGIANNPGDSISEIQLASGTQAQEYNFGELVPASISGRVHADLDGDCVIDPGETPLENVTIQLLNSGGDVVASTVTDATGAYRFDDLPPGVYGVQEVQPGGFFNGGVGIGSAGGTNAPAQPDLIRDVALVSGEQATGYNFCEHPPSTVGGQVYVDGNLNGIMEADEAGLAGVELELLNANGVVVASTVTDAGGNYQFDGLREGTYSVREIQPAGFFDGLDSAGTSGGVAHNPGDLISDITLTPGVEAANYKFGELAPASLGGRIHADLDGDCVIDPGETPLDNVTVQLLNASGDVIATTATDADGEYRFDDLPPGVYGIQEVQPSGLFNGDVALGSAGGVLAATDRVTEISLASGEDATGYNFCEHPPSTIGGHVFVDADLDGIRDAGENGIQGVSLELLDDDGSVLDATVTDADGGYSFDGLPSGTYQIREVQPLGLLDGQDSAGTAGGVAVNPGDLIREITLTPGTNAQNYDFGEILPAALSGRIHADVDGDCVVDPGETPLDNVTVALLNAGGDVIATTTTDAEGIYRFEGLAPGEYGVHESQPSGLLDGDAHVGSAGGSVADANTIVGVALQGGAEAVGYDFCEHPPAVLNGQVFVDANDDGILDDGENGIEGVQLKLLNGDGEVVATTVTDADGGYRFDGLFPGEYAVRETQPDGLLDGTDSAGTAGGVAENPGDLITGIQLVGGDEAEGYLFGEVEPASVSGHVFQDGPAVRVTTGVINLRDVNDGSLTADDSPISGVVLTLADADGDVLVDDSGEPLTVVTDADGFFQFEGLRPGVSSILETHPEGFTDGVDVAGSAGGTALNPGDAIRGFELHSGEAATDYNFSELQVNVSPTTPPVPPFTNPPPSAFPTPLAPNLLAGPPVPIPVLNAPPIVSVTVLQLPGGAVGAAGEQFTWHLSIIDGGNPRGPVNDVAEVARMTPARFRAEAWSEMELNQSTWTLGTDSQVAAEPIVFGLADGVPVTGDFDGDGVTDVGVFRDGEWFVDLNGNGRWDEGDLWVRLGRPGDQPVTGDWNGDGKTDLGVFGPQWEGDGRALEAEAGLPGAQNVSTGKHKNLPPDAHEAPVAQRLLQHTAKGDVRSDL